MLDVHRRDHVDASVEQLLDVLPALLVAATRDVGVSELVDEGHVGGALQDGVEIHLVKGLVAVVDRLAGDHLEVAQLLRGAGPVVGLDEPDDHVGAALVTSRPR